jgi:hypothetical protein
LKNKIPVLTITKSLFYHPKSKVIENSDWNDGVAWRMFYTYRNYYRIHKLNHNRLALYYYTLGIKKDFIYIIKTQKTKKIAKIRMLLYAYYYAITNKYGSLPKDVKCLSPFLK